MFSFGYTQTRFSNDTNLILIHIEGRLGPLHYRGPHPAHCAAWISVGPMVAIKWGLHTRNHTLEEPHTGGLVDGDS